MLLTGYPRGADSLSSGIEQGATLALEQALGDARVECAAVLHGGFP